MHVCSCGLGGCAQVQGCVYIEREVTTLAVVVVIDVLLLVVHS